MSAGYRNKRRKKRVLVRRKCDVVPAVHRAQFLEDWELLWKSGRDTVIVVFVLGVIIELINYALLGVW